MDAQVLRTTNWNAFSASTIEIRSVIQRLIMEAISEIDGVAQEIVKKYEYADSDSYKGPGGNTIIKIIPYKNMTDESILLAVKDSLVRASKTVDYFDQGPFQIGVGKNARYFYGHFLNTTTSEEELDQCRAYLIDILNIA